MVLIEIILFADKAYRVHLKSANGPIEVYLCPDNIDETALALSQSAVTQPATCTTDDVLPLDTSSGYTAVKQEGRLLGPNSQALS